MIGAYVVWPKDRRFKHPLYVGSTKRGFQRPLTNARLSRRRFEVGVIWFYPCRNYSEALTMEGKLTKELRPTMDLMRKPRRRRLMSFEAFQSQVCE